MGRKAIIGIYILEILEKYSSQRHRLTQEKIINYLDLNYNISIGRTTLSSYLSELKANGYIAGKRGVYKVNRLDDNELRLLIDGVLFGQHIPKDNAERLIDKLKSFSYKNLKDRVKHVCYLEGINHTQNNHLYEIIDAIDYAIDTDKKIEITPCAYAEDGELYDKEVKVVDPYYLVTEKSRYYLICYAGRDGDVENRRVDRISKVKVLDESRTPIKHLPQYAQGFDLGKYMREHIYMFSGKSSIIKIRIKSKNIGDFIDWYGREYHIIERNDEYVTVRIKANENAVYYWALQYGGIAEITSPQSLKQRVVDGLKEMLARYEDCD